MAMGGAVFTQTSKNSQDIRHSINGKLDSHKSNPSFLGQG